MNYVIMENGNVIWGIRPWNYKSLESCILDDCEVSVELPMIEPKEKIIINENIIIYPAIYNYPSYNTKIEILNGPFWSIVDDTAIGSFTVNNKDISIIKSELKKIVAANRYKQEIKDISLTIQDTPIIVEGDRFNKMMIIQIASIMGESDTYNFKFPKSNNWLAMSKTDMTILIGAFVAQTQAAFDWEATKGEEIDACTTVNELNDVVLEYV